jgi:hypothetical protein
MNATLRKPATALVYGDLCHCQVHGRFVRFVRWDGLYAVVMDRNTLLELPDYVHPTQLTPA